MHYYLRPEARQTGLSGAAGGVVCEYFLEGGGIRLPRKDVLPILAARADGRKGGTCRAAFVANGY